VNALPQDASAAPKVALVLPGAGARSAYQVGVIQAISEWYPPNHPLPFKILTGTSAGAIICALLGTHAHDFRQGAATLTKFWSEFQVNQVFRTDSSTMLRSALRWLAAILSRGWLLPVPGSLLDNTPLRAILESQIDFKKMKLALEQGVLEAVGISASSYHTGRTISFYDSAKALPQWRRSMREGVRTDLNVDHLMASSALPFVFPAVPLHDGHYGDGAMRQVAPLSPAVNLGADKVLVVTVRENAAPTAPAPPAAPSVGYVAGYMFETVFLDGLQSDLDRLDRDNQLVEACHGKTKRGLRLVQPFLIEPTTDFGRIAENYTHLLPKNVHTLLRLIGADNSAGRQVLSYLLFEGGYTRELIRVGYADAMAQRERLMEFLDPQGLLPVTIAPQKSAALPSSREPDLSLADGIVAA
jgi:NTE family protein